MVHCLIASCPAFSQFRESEIRDCRPEIIVKQDILRLQIPMNDPMLAHEHHPRCNSQQNHVFPRAIPFCWRSRSSFNMASSDPPDINGVKIDGGPSESSTS
jgi:hypothetical protein